MRVLAAMLCGVVLGACAEAQVTADDAEVTADDAEVSKPGRERDAEVLGWDLVADDAAVTTDDLVEIPADVVEVREASAVDSARADVADFDAGLRPDLVMAVDLGSPVRDVPPPPVDVPPPPVDVPPRPRCGDGLIDPGEVCDDGNTAEGDLCASDCRTVACAFPRAFLDPGTRRCYWRESSVVRRSEAVARCEAQSASLASFESSAEREAVYPHMGLGGSNRVWLGLQRRNGNWQWDTGADLAYMGFRGGEPSGDGDCVEWGPANGFNDLGCSNTRDFVCERAPPGRPR